MKNKVQYIAQFMLLCTFALIIMATSVYADDPRTWQFKAPMSVARTGVSAVVLDDLVYVMGGLDAQGNVLDLVERYDPDTNTWQSAPKLRTPRFNATAVVFEDNIYLIGGQDSLGNALKKVEVFVSDENDWESFDNLQDEREGPAAIVLNGEVYVMGGSNGSANILDSVEFLDTDEEKWEYTNNWILDVPRALFAYVTLDDAAYSIGGFSSFGPMGLVQRYSEDEGVADLPSLVPGRGGLSAAVLDDVIYAMGGRRSDNTVVNAVNRFLPEENRWESAPSLNTERERFASVVINDQIFVFGGNTSNGTILNSIETFATSVVPNPTDDVLVTNEDTQMSVNVLINDQDPAGGTLAISSFSQPQNGSVSQLDAQSFTYEPDTNFFGTDQFSYTAINETGGTAQAVVNITVQPVNDQPAFTSQPVLGGAQDAAYTYTVVVFDIDNDAITFDNISVPGWLSFSETGNGIGLLTGTPTNAELGDHVISLSATDGFESATQTFTLTVVEGAPGESVLLSPANGAQDLPATITLSWEVPGAVSFDLEVALDGAFSNISTSASGLTTSTFELSGLDPNTTYFWRVRGTNAAGTNGWSTSFEFRTALDTAIEDEVPAQPFALLPNYPNPFKDQTSVVFEVSGETSAAIHLDVYDLRGRHLLQLESGYFSPGSHRVLWNGVNAEGQPLASGTYLLRLQAGEIQQTRLITLIR